MDIFQIIGKGGIAREIAAYMSYDVIQRNIVMFENECDGISPDYPTVIAIGDGSVRKKVAEQFAHLRWGEFFEGFCYGPRTSGQGLMVCPGTVLTTDIKVGLHVLVNLNCTIGHDCVIGDYVTVSPSANISGNVTIGDNCYIGTNASIREKISICDDVVIGAGGVVVKDIELPGIYVGNPVKRIG